MLEAGTNAWGSRISESNAPQTLQEHRGYFIICPRRLQAQEIRPVNQRPPIATTQITLLTRFCRWAKIELYDGQTQSIRARPKGENMRSKTQISVRRKEDIAIFDITGYLTEDSEADMNAAYEQSEAASKILLNFDRDSFITSSGFGLIVKLIWKIRNKDQILRVAHPSEQVRRTFNIIGLTRSLEIFVSEEEALTGL
jgi:anti-anti-sigma factor